MLPVVIALAITGIILLAVEIFVIPGFGVSGILGIAALIAAIVVAAGSVLEAAVYSLVFFIIVSALLYIGYRWQKQNASRGLFLGTRQSNRDGYVASKPSYEQYLGRYGLALSPLRPAGTADFSGQRLDVVTEGGFIERGSTIKVIAVEGGRIIVRAEP